MSHVSIVNPTNPRMHLALLQMTCLMLYGVHLPLLPAANLAQVGLVLALAVMMLMVATVPRGQLAAPWFVGMLTLGNAGLVFHALTDTRNNPAWIVCAVMLLLAMGSAVASLTHFVVLSSLLMAGYGLSLYQTGLFQTDALLYLPCLLCLMLVFVSKGRIMQTELARLTQTEEQSRSKSMSDALTSLPNRAQFLEQVSRSVQWCRSNRSCHFAVLFVDLDGFKPINDRLGHKAGDAVLRHTAKVFQGCLRKGDTVARYGGDEFTFLINNVKTSDEAVRVAERILAKLQSPIDVGEMVMVGASIGIAMSTNLHERAEDLIRDADGAMYRAKAQGKNRYVVSDQSSDIPKSELKERLKRVALLKWSPR